MSKTSREYHIWDFWYMYRKSLYYVYFLNAPKELVASAQHHFHAQVGLATTQDFKSFTIRKWNLLTQDAIDQSSIWSGSVFDNSRFDGLYYMFYTARMITDKDPFTQYITFATSKNLIDWTKSGIKIFADPTWYETHSIEGDNSIHAWRDPFVYRYHNRYYMLISAKDKNMEITRKGCVGQARSFDLKNWEILPPLKSTGNYSECEVPQIYVNDNDERIVFFSTWADKDYCPISKRRGGFHGYNLNRRRNRVILPERSGMYACRIIPELNLIGGFDTVNGGIITTPLRLNLHQFKDYASW